MSYSCHVTFNNECSVNENTLLTGYVLVECFVTEYVFVCFMREQRLNKNVKNQLFY